MTAPVNFCQVCGGAMRDEVRYGRLRRACPACGFVHFRDPKVAAAVLVERDGRLMLVRRAVNPERGKWALPAGYIDFDEEPAAAAAREVREETGLEVEILRLLAVESGPGITGEPGASIVIVFQAQVTGGTERPLDDVTAILWLGRDEPEPEIAFESTRSMLEAWRAGRT